MASIAAVAELPPHLIEAITNAAAVTEAKTYTNAAGASLNYRFHAPAKVEPGKRYPLSSSCTAWGRADRTTRGSLAMAYGPSSHT